MTCDVNGTNGDLRQGPGLYRGFRVVAGLCRLVSNGVRRRLIFPG